MALDPRTELAPELYTLRTQLVEGIKQALRDAPFKDSEPDGIKLFENVEGGVLDDITTSMTPAGRVEEGDETPDAKFYSVVDETFRLYVHFKVVSAEGVDPEPMVNYYVGRITQVLVTPTHFGGIAMDITEAGNSIQYQGKSDTEPGGSVFYDIEYRHGRGNRFSEASNGNS